MVARRRRGWLYAAAFAITTVVFILGILLGIVIEERRLMHVERKYAQDRINYESLQLQYLYLATLAEGEGCEAFSATLNNYLKKLEETRIRLEGYSKEGDVFPGDFTKLQRRYIIAELNYWLLAKKTGETCDADTVSILFFYSPECSECENQGYVLDYLKRVFGDRLLIFSLDEAFEEEPMISIVKDAFNVTMTPTVVVGDQKLDGFRSKEELKQIICERYANTPEGC